MRLIRRSNIAKGTEFVSDGQRRVIRMYTHLGPCMKIFWVHLLYFPVAVLLIHLSPPFHELFFATDKIADILPHRIFGILSVSQDELDAIGVALPRSAIIHLIVEQILMLSFFVIWALARTGKAWKSYPAFEEHYRYIYENYDSVENHRRKKARMAFLPALIIFPVLTVYPLISSELLLYGLESVNSYGLLAFFAWGSMWSFCGLGLFWAMIIIHARRYLMIFSNTSSAHQR